MQCKNCNKELTDHETKNVEVLRKYLSISQAGHDKKWGDLICESCVDKRIENELQT